jgi:hypothetical protein
VDTTLNCLDWHWFTRSDPEHRVLLYSIVMGRVLDNIYIPVDKDVYKPVEYESLKYPPLLWYVWKKKLNSFTSAQSVGGLVSIKKLTIYT